MTGWVLPLLAGSFWAGILLWWSPAGRGAPEWGWLILGLVALTAGVALAPRPGARRRDAPSLARILPPSDRDGGSPIVPALEGTVPAPAMAPPAVPVLAAVLAFICLGAGWAGLHERELKGSPLVRLAPASVRATGSLRSDPAPGGLGWSARFGVGRVEVLAGPGPPRAAFTTKGTVWLEGAGSIPRASRDDEVEAVGHLVRPSGPFAGFLLRQGIGVVLEAETVHRVGPSRNPLVRAAQAVRGELLGRIRAEFPPRQAGLLMGLALGDTSLLDPGDEEHFRATGLGHLLAVSGENVAMVLAPVLGLALLMRLSVLGRFVLGSTTVLFFVVLTGEEPSVLRAGVMAGLALLGVLLGRPRSTGAILGGTILILLVSDPSLVWSIGFQLSVAATAGIVALAGPLASRMRALPRPLAIALATTVSAQLGVSPLLLDQFHQVPGVTLLANMLAFPAVAPAMLLGLAAAGVSAVAPPFAHPLALLAAVPIRYLEVLADRLASAPVPSVTSNGGPAVLLVGYVAVAALAWWLRSGRRLPRPAFVGLAVILPLFVWTTAISAGPPSGLVVRFFDVGQGDAALVQSPGGANVLIDGGPDPQLAATKLTALGIKRLDVVIATHPHLDHYEGLPAVLARFPVGLVLDTGCHPSEVDSGPYQGFLHAVREEGAPERHPVDGDRLVVGDLLLRFLSPDRCWQGTNSDANNDSLVILVTYRGDSVLFANEPEGPAQQAMLDRHEPIQAEVLNVPHHGAGTSIFPFFQAVHEALAVVSVGPNRYGHPVPLILQELRDTGARVIRTDRAGDVTIRFEPGGLVVTTGHGRRLLLQSAAG